MPVPILVTAPIAGVGVVVGRMDLTRTPHASISENAYKASPDCPDRSMLFEVPASPGAPERVALPNRPQVTSAKCPAVGYCLQGMLSEVSKSVPF